MDVLLELADGLCGEGMSDGLALASVFGAIAGVEQTALNRNESIVVVTVRRLDCDC